MDEVNVFQWAEIATMYSPRITHLLRETIRSALAQQVLRDDNRLVTAIWLNDVIINQHKFPFINLTKCYLAGSRTTLPQYVRKLVGI